jgi:predicted nucleotidyltransferase
MVAVHPRLAASEEQIEAFCQKWKIVRLELFGSVLRDDFDDASDIDLLVTFAPDARKNLFGLVRMEDELGDLLGREVDLVERKAIEESPNWIRRKAILSSVRQIYAAV